MSVYIIYTLLFIRTAKKNKFMKVEKEMMVSIEYQLFENDFDGNPIETVSKEKPLQFLFGSGMLLKDFEANLEGKNEGDNFEFKLSPEVAYGKHVPEKIVDIPKTAFEVEGKIDESLLVPGKIIPMQDKQGNKFNGTIKEIMDDKVKIDFNHPLADTTLAFKGIVNKIRPATEKELNAQKLGHDPNACEGCGESCN